jgi:hypothetical protein
MRVGANGNVRLEFNSNGERDVVFNIYRDGVMVAAGLSRTTWEDQDGAGLCYGVEAQYVTSGNVSYRSAPQCLQRDGVTDEIHADDARWVVHDGATREINHGRYHFNDWGRPEQALTLQGYVPRASGKYMFQLVYGNGYDISTGVTAGVKRVEILRANVVVASGFAVMPHLKNWDTWAESTGVAADLEAGRSYTVRISDAFNMSYFAHFNAYKGRGGRDGAVNRVNLSGVIIFSR